jgi:hypothetical protein
VTAPRILVREDAKTRQKGADPAPELGWYLLGGLGLVFAMVGGLDILLAWYPPDFGSAEWKFGTVTATLNSFPLLSLGLILLTVSGLARGRTWVVRTMLVVLALVVVVIIGCAALYLPQIGTAMGSASDPTVKMGLKRAITKTSVQLVLYPVLLGWIAVLALKRFRSTA